MRSGDLETFSLVGQALWSDSQRSQVFAMETLSAISLLDISPERRIERAASALLSRAHQTGSQEPGALEQPFYRLSAEERLVLSALHCGKWPYERIGRVLGRLADEVAELAWASRMDLAIRPGQARPILHPFGTDTKTQINCPEYNPARPWTQSFLDDQMQVREKLFIQNHLGACENCRQALSRARILYYAVDALIPRATDLQRRVAAFERILFRSRAIREPLTLSFWESLVVFFGRKEIRRFLLGSAIFFGILLSWWS